jgi:hypothetical protein
VPILETIKKTQNPKGENLQRIISAISIHEEKVNNNQKLLSQIPQVDEK